MLKIDDMNLNELAAECYANAKTKGFWRDQDIRSTPEKIALMHSELSEALEDYRANHTALILTSNKEEPAQPPKPTGLPAELADVIIRVLDYCGRFNIDIQDAVERKMAYNASRPYMHGKIC